MQYSKIQLIDTRKDDRYGHTEAVVAFWDNQGHCFSRRYKRYETARLAYVRDRVNSDEGEIVVLKGETPND